MNNEQFYQALEKYDAYNDYHYYYDKKKRPAKKRPASKRKRVEEIMSTALVRPGDIKDAADSTDLLEQLRAANILKVEDTLDARTRAEMRKDREREIFENYLGKATDYYKGMWERCGSSPVGHNWISLDVGDSTIMVCDTCSFPKGKKTGGTSYDGSTKTNQSRAEEYKDELKRGLAKQLIALDEEAGLIETPKDEDFIGLERKYGQRKRRLFR